MNSFYSKVILQKTYKIPHVHVSLFEKEKFPSFSLRGQSTGVIRLNETRLPALGSN